MAPVLRWDPEKARSNLRKHRVAFEEAASVFRDVLSVTISDPLHSTDESRLVTIGRSDRGRTLVVVHSDFEETIRIISARRPARGGNTKKARSKRKPEEMLSDYDFSGGVRGKYASRFANGTIMVVLDPDVAELFPDPRSANRALRALGHIIRDSVRQPGRRRSLK
jgi:uncharacterized DUF497 family protein